MHKMIQDGWWSKQSDGSTSTVHIYGSTDASNMTYLYSTTHPVKAGPQVGYGRWSESLGDLLLWTKLTIGAGLLC